MSEKQVRMEVNGVGVGSLSMEKYQGRIEKTEKIVR